MKIEDVFPTLDRVLVVPDAIEDEERISGLVIPASCQESQAPNKSAWGTAKAVGPDVKYVRKGDRVISPLFAGVEQHDDNGKRFLLTQEKDLLAVEHPSA